MKDLLKMMKKGDILIIGLLVILSFLPLAYFNSQNKQKDTNVEPEDYVTFSVDGEEMHRMTLTAAGEEEYLYENDIGHMNLIKREGTSVHMANANCADSLCMLQGEISKPGETIVCLPHRVIVEVKTQDPNAESDEEVDFVP